MRILKGNAFTLNHPPDLIKGDPGLARAPSFVVVSIFDKHPPGPEWMRGTSLKSFGHMVHLDKNNYNNANCERIRIAWDQMRDQCLDDNNNNNTTRNSTNSTNRTNTFKSIQEYYRVHPHPVPAYRLVKLDVNGTVCQALLVHAPNFTTMDDDDKAMSMLVSLYRVIFTICSLRGGDRASARMAPLSAGVFSHDRQKDAIIAACVKELFVPGLSAPITVFGYSDYEMTTLKRYESERQDGKTLVGVTTTLRGARI